MRLLTVMRGLEFAAGGEFIMTVIPLERYSVAYPPTHIVLLTHAGR